MRPSSSTPRSARSELESLLSRHRIADYQLLEEDSDVTLRFALDERHVQLIVPLPDRWSDEFLLTPSGRPRALGAQERAYEREVRRRWLALRTVLKGKLVAAECGVSALEDAYVAAIEPTTEVAAARRRSIRLPRAVVTIVGLAILVPASSMAALALPSNAVSRLVGHIASTQPDMLGTSAALQRVALGMPPV